MPVAIWVLIGLFLLPALSGAISAIIIAGKIIAILGIIALFFIAGFLITRLVNSVRHLLRDMRG